MCGICGIYSSSENNASLQLIKEMLESVAHRGPDERNILFKESSAMGAARLSLVDKKEGGLPFVDHERNKVVLFNGEIYNYRELLNNLINKGVVFHTRSEGEVISALYDYYGDSFASHLEGMFAIAVYDEEGFTLVRDPCGIKPLFYYTDSGIFAFASEIKGLLPVLPSFPTINREVLEEYAVFGYPVASRETIFREIKQVAPGEMVKWTRKGLSYYDFSSSLLKIATDLAGTDQISYELAVDKLKKTMFEAVDVMWRHGDDEKAIYLSGGIDSSLIAAIAAELGYSINSYTLTDGGEHQDRYYAELVSRSIGSKHREIRITVEDYIETLPHYISHFEGVVTGGVFDIHGGIAFHLLSKEISKQFKIAFSGEGADELFAGYRWIHTHPLGLSDRLNTRAENLSDSGVKNILNKLFPVPEDEEQYRFNLFCFLHGSGLANYHLASVDRSSGAFGFEVRPVYLYPGIYETACRLPLSYKIPDKGITKKILRDVARPIFEKMGIGEVVNRSKQGMPAAVNGIAAQVDKILFGMGDCRKKPHPFEGLFNNDRDYLMFDLFYYLMVVCKGKLPSNFTVKDFVLSGQVKSMYN